jgi:hypothetical protein
MEPERSLEMLFGSIEECVFETTEDAAQKLYLT